MFIFSACKTLVFVFTVLSKVLRYLALYIGLSNDSVMFVKFITYFFKILGNSLLVMQLKFRQLEQLIMHLQH